MKRLHRVLVVGAGGIGRVHVEALRGTGRAEVAVCEPRADQRQRIQEDFSLQHAFGSLDDALQQHWQAAVIATPASTHLEIGQQLTAAGVPMLVEKPLAVVTDGLAAWAAAIETRRIPAMVGFTYRCHPVLVAVRRELQAGRIGRPLQVVARRGAHLPTRRPDYASTYYARREQGGGVVQDILSHVVNAVEWLVGPLDHVMAAAAHLRLPGVAVEDTVSAVARHGPVLASYTVNQHQLIAEFTVDIHGTEGSLRVDLIGDCWSIASDPDGGWTTQRLPPLSKIQWFTRQADVFLDVVEERATPPCSIEEGLHTLKAILATLEAASRSGAWTTTAGL